MPKSSSISKLPSTFPAQNLHILYNEFHTIKLSIKKPVRQLPLSVQKPDSRDNGRLKSAPLPPLFIPRYPAFPWKEKRKKENVNNQSQ